MKAPFNSRPGLLNTHTLNELNIHARVFKGWFFVRQCVHGRSVKLWITEGWKAMRRWSRCMHQGIMATLKYIDGPCCAHFLMHNVLRFVQSVLSVALFYVYFRHGVVRIWYITWKFIISQQIDITSNFIYWQIYGLSDRDDKTCGIVPIHKMAVLKMGSSE